MSLRVSNEFQESYYKATDYPSNLCDSNTYSTILHSYKERLQKAAGSLCVTDPSDVHVAFRDLIPSIRPCACAINIHQDPNHVCPTILEFKKQNLYHEPNLSGENALKRWIGDQSVVDTVTGRRTGNVFTKTDPLLRFIFLYGADSQSPLKLSKEMLVSILSYHQVMPSFLEFLLLFGMKTRAIDLRYSGFREETCLSNPIPALNMPALGRSGRHFELCYNLKGVTEKSPADWRIHHAALYHKFDVSTGKAVWIVVKGNLDLKNKIEPVTGRQLKDQDHNFMSVESLFASSLAIHLLVAHWAGESWRWYLQYLEEVMEKETRDARYEDREKSASVKYFTSRDLQNIQMHTEKANEIVSVIESNMEVLTAMRSFYEKLIQDAHFPFRTAAEESVLRTTRQLNNITYDLKMQSARAKLLVQEIQSRKDLILQHLQSQNTQSMEMLTSATYEVTKVAQKDAIAIRIITIVTLFYLPATFVSSFFSTDVVKYQSQDPSVPNDTTSFSQIALNRWMQVTLPLTALTLMLAYGGYRLAKFYVKKRDKFELVAV